MGAVQRHVLDGEVSHLDEVVLLKLGRAEVGLYGSQDCPQTFAALEAGGVVDQVGGHELVQNGVIRRAMASEQFPDHVAGATRV